MRYSLVVKRNNTINNTNDFKEIKGYAQKCSEKEYNEDNIASIVRFTSTFKDEISLKEFLIFYGLIDEEDINNDLSIVFFKGNNIKELDGGITYLEDFRMFKRSAIQSYIKDNFEDSNFMDAFLKKFMDDLDLKNVPYFNEELFKIANANMHFKNYGIRLPETDIYIDRFVIKYIYKYDNKKKHITKELDRARTREIAMFINNYANIDKRTESMQEAINELENTRDHYIYLSGFELNQEVIDTYNKKIEDINYELQLLKGRSRVLRRR